MHMYPCKNMHQEGKLFEFISKQYDYTFIMFAFES